MNSSLHFLIQSNAPQAVSYYPSNFGPLENTIRMSGYSHRTLDQVLSGVCRRAQQAGKSVQIIHNSLDNTIQGLILPEQSAGVYGFDIFDPSECSSLAAAQQPAFAAIQRNWEAARQTYQKAKAIHDEQEKVYIGNMDFAAADRLTEETVQMLLDGKTSGHAGRGTDRFFGAATVNGNVNYIPEVTQGIQKRYFVKGRPGTGKSTFLKKIAWEAIRRGFDTEIYHCSFDPNSLDLVAVRELGFCLFDSTAPHEYFPSRPEDEIIDIYEKCVTPGTDEKYQTELDQLQTAYKEMLLNAAVCLKNVKKACDAFDETLPPLGQAAVDDLTQQLIQKLI